MLSSYHTPPSTSNEKYLISPNSSIYYKCESNRSFHLMPETYSPPQHNINNTRTCIANKRPRSCNSPKVSTMHRSQITQTLVASKPMHDITNITAPPQQQQQQKPAYYTYQKIPSHINHQNMKFSHYSLGQQIQKGRLLSNLQHQSTILESCHTPPQLKHHQNLTPVS